ncbi:MAG: NAD(P)/FAD-dependent oxidoreductase [Patescibacteria group bacterium]
MESSPHIIIVGGGFGGVYTAKYLLSYGYIVTLINERNYFTFTPMLHEVATGGLHAQDIIFEFQSFFKDDNFNFVRGHVSHVDLEKKTVYIGTQAIAGDYIVFATGAVTHTHGIQGSEAAYELKTIDDAKEIKQKIIELIQGPEQSAAITIIGAGPTGIELAFEVEQFTSELQALSGGKDTSYTIRLLNHSDHILRNFPKKIQNYTHQLLQKSSIKFLENTTVDAIHDTEVVTSRGTFPSTITIMTSGVRPNTECLDKDMLSQRDHVAVRKTLQLEQHDRIFALGDIIMINGDAMPKLAQAATDQASIVAQNIKALIQNKSSLQEYFPNLRGLLISLGCHQGAGSIHGIILKGWFAWWLWRTVYLFKIPGVQNKIRIAFTWTLGLFTKRSLVEE